MIKILCVFQTETGVNYLCIDHVYDKKKGTVYRLLNTIVFKIKQDQISLVYDLVFLQVCTTLLLFNSVNLTHFRSHI